jgi:integrase
MRRGEICGLQWQDLDLDRAVLRVERSLEETKAGLRRKPPKTKRGRRNISLPADTVVLLRAHKVKQMEWRLAIGAGALQPDAPVFATIEGGLMSPDNLSRDWRRVVLAKNLPRVPFHAVRHTHVSLLLAAGVDIIAVSRRLGHSKASITLDVYGHLVGGADEAAAAAIGKVLK